MTISIGSNQRLGLKLVMMFFKNKISIALYNIFSREIILNTKCYKNAIFLMFLIYNITVPVNLLDCMLL